MNESVEPASVGVWRNVAQ